MMIKRLCTILSLIAFIPSLLATSQTGTVKKVRVPRECTFDEEERKYQNEQKKLY